MLITNANLITWEDPNRILYKHALYIDQGKITDIGLSDELVKKYPETERVDAGNQYVMPGNICSHTHFYGAFARGLGIPGQSPKDFSEILQKLWWPLDKSLTHDAIKLSTQVMLIDAIKNGTTTLIDHHASPNAIDGSLDTIAQVVEQAGTRVCLCYEVTDRDGLDKSNAGIKENIRFIKAHPRESSSTSNSLVAATFGLHASLTLSDETLDTCREAVPEEIGFHIHVAEHEVDQYDSLAKTGLRVVDRLYRHHILGPHTIAAHAVHVDAREIELLSESGTWVTHQPRSNMNNGVGVAPVEEMLRAGVRVGFGTDGFSHTMWEEWKCAYLLHKVWHRDPRRMAGLDIIRMGILNNSALVNQLFPHALIGSIQPGMAADLIFVDYHPFTPLNPENLPWHILFGFNEGLITTTIVNGKILMKERKLLTLDEDEICARAQEYSTKVWDQYRRNSNG